MMTVIKTSFTVMTAFGVFMIFGHYRFQQVPVYTMKLQIDSEKEIMAKKESCDVTVVSAYIDLGSFQKGPKKSNINNKQLYFDRAKVFRYLVNPLIVYTDSKAFKDYMLMVRTNRSTSTKVILVKRESLWAFQNVEEVRRIYSQPDYPKRHPGTTYPEYACTQYAKFDFLRNSIKDNIFAAKYYTWIDIGYFRDRDSKKQFYLCTPHEFNASKIAMSLVRFDSSLKRNPYEIMRKPHVLVGGGVIFGRSDELTKMVSDFQRAVTHFLSKGLANTDQTVIYAMNTEIGKKLIQNEVEIQFYKPEKQNDWFYLGNSMIREVNSSDVNDNVKIHN